MKTPIKRFSRLTDTSGNAVNERLTKLYLNTKRTEAHQPLATPKTVLESAKQIANVFHNLNPEEREVAKKVVFSYAGVEKIGSNNRTTPGCINAIGMKRTAPGFKGINASKIAAFKTELLKVLTES
jgi:hypothetical protein